MTSKIVTKRITAYMADVVYQWLEQWAEEEGRSLSSLATYVLETAARDRYGSKVKTGTEQKQDDK